MAKKEENKNVLITIIIIFAIIILAIWSLGKINIFSQQKEQSEEPQQRTDCTYTNGACLKIIDASWRRDDIGSHGWHRIVGQVQNVGESKNNRNPWHAIEGSCYYQGRLINTQGDTFDLLEPNEMGTFNIHIETFNEEVDSCKVKILY